MSKRQHNLRPANNPDNTSRYQVVYPGVSKKILFNQHSSSSTTLNSSSNIDIDSNTDNINYSKTSSNNNNNNNQLYNITRSPPAIREQQKDRHKLDILSNQYNQNYNNINNAISDIDHKPPHDNIKKDQLRVNNTSTDIENLKLPYDTNNNTDSTKSFDLDWIDSRRVQCDPVYGSKRNSLASNQNITYNQCQQQNKNPAKSVTNLPFPLIHRRSDHNIRDNYHKIPAASIRNNSYSKSNKTIHHYASQMASNTNIGSNVNTNDSDNILFDISNDEATGFYDDGQNLEGQLADGQLTDDRSRKGQVPYDYNLLDEPIMNTLLRDLGGIYEKMKIIALPNRSNDVYKIILRGWDLWGPLLLCTFLAFSLHNDTTSGTRNSIGPHFADVFVLIWFGSGLLSLNYRLLCLSSMNDQSIQIMPGNTNSSTTDSSGDKTTIISSNLHINNNNNKINDDITSPNRSIPIGPSADLGSMENPDNGMPSIGLQNPMQLSISPPSILQLMCVFGYCLVAPSIGLFILKLFPISSLMIWRMIVGVIFGFMWPTWSSIKILKQYQHPNKRTLAIYPIGLFYFILSCMIILNQ